MKPAHYKRLTTVPRCESCAAPRMDVLPCFNCAIIRHSGVSIGQALVNLIWSIGKRFTPWSALESWSAAGCPITAFSPVTSLRIIKVCEQVQEERKLFAGQRFNYRYGRGITLRVKRKPKQVLGYHASFRAVMDTLFTGSCFYCKCRLAPERACLDMVIPFHLEHAHGQLNSNWLVLESSHALNNLRVACCNCNGSKGISESRGISLLRGLYAGIHTVIAMNEELLNDAPPLSFEQLPWMDNHSCGSRMGKCGGLAMTVPVIRDRLSASLLRVTDWRPFNCDRFFQCWYDAVTPSIIFTAWGEQPRHAIYLLTGKMSDGAYWAMRYRARNKGLTPAEKLAKGRHAVPREKPKVKPNAG